MRRLFNEHSDIIEIIVRDGSGKRIDQRMANLSDEEAVKKIFGWLKGKYGLFIPENKGILTLDSDFLKP